MGWWLLFNYLFFPLLSVLLTLYYCEGVARVLAFLVGISVRSFSLRGSTPPLLMAGNAFMPEDAGRGQASPSPAAIVTWLFRVLLQSSEPGSY